MKRIVYSIFVLLLWSGICFAQNNEWVEFNFEGNLKSNNLKFEATNYQFVKGVNGQALSLKANKKFNNLSLKNLPLDGSKDFTVQFWVQTSSSKPMVLLSQKQFPDKSIKSQKNKGWVLYSSGGTFGWSIGSGDRRLNYERENGEKMPINDGQWHQLTMTYEKELSEIRLYYDGHNKAIYKVGFDFSNDNPLMIGSLKNDFNFKSIFLPQIISGETQLQKLVDEFNSLLTNKLEDDEFLSLITNPDELLAKKRNQQKSNSSDLEKVKSIRKELLKNQYTVFQNMKLTVLKPVSKIYYLENGKVKINKEAASSFTQQAQLFPSDFKIDDLTISGDVFCADKVLENYNKFKNSEAFPLAKNIKSLNVGVWNIWHGGKHWSMKDHGWDSRMRIVELIKEKDLDVILMQETYSSGDLIAAELGYYFATTSDWDYCFQGSNISVISRYPIKEIFVPQEASFMNVGVKLALSESQEIYAMSNWYGMSSFPLVYDFHTDKFEKADEIPILFGGDFNAVPHTDGGQSPASVKMLENGFTDAYRSLHPNVETHPGFSHQSGSRIDQLYYKGKGLKNISTEVISNCAAGFPSDHFMIFSKFELTY